MPLVEYGEDYVNDQSGGSNESNTGGMWIEMAMNLFGMGQENTIRNQQLKLAQNEALAGVLFRDRRSNEQLFVILGIFLLLAVVFFVVIKK